MLTFNNFCNSLLNSFSIRSSLSLFFFLLLACSNSETETYEWTRFRGSDGQGIDTKWSAPVKWESSDFRWEIELPGKGNASPVVWGNTIYVTSADENNIGYVFAVDAGNGKIRWEQEFKLTELLMHPDNNLAAATPAVDESQVYIIWYTKEKTELIALSHDGYMQWKTSFEGIETRHGGGSSLMLTDKNVVFTREQETGSSVKSSWIAVDKSSGNTAWELERETVSANSFSTPVLVKNDSQVAQLIFTSWAHGITGVDPETGAILWENPGLIPNRAISSPVYSDGKVIGCYKNGGAVLNVDLNTNKFADSALYNLPRNLSPYVPTPIIVGELLFLFIDNGTVACLHFSTGELLWKERPAGAIYGSPVCVGENIYCMIKDGKVIVIKADDTYQLMGINELGDGSYSTPVMCSSGIVFRTFSRLILLGNK